MDQHPPVASDLPRHQTEALSSANENGPATPPASEVDALPLVHELQVRLSELELQNAELLRSRNELPGTTERVQTEADAHASAGFLQAALDSLSAHIAILDETGSILAVNDAWRQFGRENSLVLPADALGCNYLRICELAGGREAAEALPVAQAIRQLLAGLITSAHIEYPCHAPSEQRWFVAHLSAFKDKAQVRVVVAHENITVRKQAEQTLRQQQNVLHLFVENSPAAIAMFDRDMRYLVASRRYLIDYDLGEQDVVGRSHYDIFPEIPERWKAIHRRCLAGAIESADADPFPRASGKLDWIRWEIRPWHQANGDIGGIILLSEVITERRQAEAALRESEGRYRGLFDNQHAVMLIIDPDDGAIVDANPAACAYYGWSRAELLARRIDDINTLTPAEIADELQAASAEARSQYFFKHRRADGSVRDVEVYSGPVLHDGQTMRYSIVHDITERKRAEALLHESEAQMRRAQHFAHLGNWTWDIKTNRLDWSDEMYHIFGLDQSTFSGNLSDVIAQTIHPDDRAKVAQSNLAVAGEGKPTPLEYRVVLPGGTVRTLWGEAGELIRDETGAPSLLRGTVQDITERKQMESTLRESEQRFRSFVEQSSDGFALVDEQGRITEWNSAQERITGKARAQVLGRCIWDVQLEIAGIEDPTPERIERTRQAILAALRTGQSPLFEGSPEYQLTGAGGAVRYVQQTIFPIRMESGFRLGASSRDVTERRQGEVRMRQLSRAVEQSPASIMITDRSGQIEYVNPRFSQVSGYASAEVVGRSPLILQAGAEAQANYQQMWRTIQSGQEWRGELLNRKKSGEIYWELISVSCIADEHGTTTHYLATGEDITERKRAETALRESEVLLRQAQRFARLGNWTWHIQTNQLDWSDEMYRLFGVDKQTFSRSLLDVIARAIHPADRAKVEQANLVVSSTGVSAPLEYRIVLPDGTVRVVWAAAGELIRDAAGAPAVLRGTVQDITERKQVEEELRRSEARLRQAQNLAGLGVWEWEIESDTTVWSDEMLRIYGITRAEFTGRGEDYINFTHPDDRHIQRANIRKDFAHAAVHAQETGELVDETSEPKEFRIIRRDGSIRWVRGDAVEVLDEHGKPLRMHGILWDITERKLAEEQQELQSAALNAAANAVVITGRDGAIEWVNPAFSAITGYSLLEAVGKNPSTLIKSGQHDPEFYRQMWETIAAGRVWQGEMVNRRKDGSLYVDEQTITPVLGANGAPTHFIAIKQDISERKRAEAQLLASENQYRRLFESANDGILILGADSGTIIDVNPALVKLLGYPYEAFVGKNVWEMTFVSDFIASEARFLEMLQAQFIQSEDTERTEYMRYEDLPLVTADGRRITVEFVSTMYTVNQQKVIQCNIRDTTQRKRAEDALRQSEARYRTLIEQAADGIFIADAQGRYLDVNSSACALLGYSRDELIGADYTLILTPADLAADPPNLGLLLDGQTLVRERLYRRKDGALVPIEISAKLLSDGRVQSIVRDISERKRAEQARRARLSELEALYAVSVGLRTVQTSDQTLALLMDHALAALDAGDGFVALYDPAAGELRAAVTRGIYRDLPNPTRKPGEGIVGFVFVTGQTHTSLDLARDPLAFPPAVGYFAPGWGSICVPIRSGATIIGALSVSVAPGRSITPEQVKLLEALAEMGGAAQQRLRLYEETARHLDQIQQEVVQREHAEAALSRRLAELEALYAVSVAMRSAQTREDALPILMDHALAALETDTGYISLYYPELGGLRAPVRRGLVLGIPRVTLKPGEGVMGTVFATGNTHVNAEIRSDPLAYAETARLMPAGWSSITVAIRSGESIVGIMSVSVQPGRAITPEQVKLLEALAEMGGAAVHRMNLYDEVAQQLTQIKEEVNRRQAMAEIIRHRLAELEALHSVSVALRSAQTVDEALPILLDQALAALETDTGIIWVYDPATELLEAGVSRGLFQLFKLAPRQPGEGIAGQVFSSGNPYVTADFASDPIRLQPAAGQIPPGWGAACVPIRTGQSSVGVLVVAVPPGRPIAPEQVILLESLAEMGGTAMHRMRLNENTARQLGRLQSLHNVDVAISSGIDLRVTLGVLLENLKTHLNVDAADVLLFDPRTLTLEYVAGLGFRTHAVRTARVRVSESLAGQAVLARREVHAARSEVDRFSAQFAAVWAQEDFASYYGVPLIAKGEVKGVLELYQRTPFYPDQEWAIYLESLSGQAAIAIDNAQLFDKLQRSNVELSLAYDATIEGWSRAMDLRDKETEGHTLRVTALAEQLARAMGIDESQLVHVRRGALLHDIGKMGVPDGILLKAGPLSADEWDIMRKHPQYAYDMLSPIAYLRPALDIPRYHHEKWDGTGYPLGLQGEQIPLVARLFAVIDVWDALRSDRPYRPAWPLDKVRDHIRALSGTHFDPRVVDTFVALIDSQSADRGLPARKPTLLIVDDEPNITRSLARGLRDGFQITLAGSGAEALAILQRDEVAVVLTDQRMPQMTGLELIEQIGKAYPQTLCILLSGYADTANLSALSHLGNVRGLVSKPWDPGELRQLLDKAAQEYDSLRQSRRPTPDRLS